MYKKALSSPYFSSLYHFKYKISCIQLVSMCLLYVVNGIWYEDDGGGGEIEIQNETTQNTERGGILYT